MILEARKAEDRGTSMQEHTIASLSHMLQKLQKSQQPARRELRKLAKSLGVPQMSDGHNIDGVTLFKTPNEHFFSRWSCWAKEDAISVPGLLPATVVTTLLLGRSSRMCLSSASFPGDSTILRLKPRSQNKNSRATSATRSLESEPRKCLTNLKRAAIPSLAVHSLILLRDYLQLAAVHILPPTYSTRLSLRHTRQTMTTQMPQRFPNSLNKHVYSQCNSCAPKDAIAALTALSAKAVKTLPLTRSCNVCFASAGFPGN